MSSMLDTMQSMQNGMGTMSSGISGINAVRQQLIKDRGTIDPKTDAALTAGKADRRKRFTDSGAEQHQGHAR